MFSWKNVSAEEFLRCKNDSFFVFPLADCFPDLTDPGGRCY